MDEEFKTYKKDAVKAAEELRYLRGSGEYL